MSIEVGAIVGDYEVLGPLGRGGMGTVFKVRNTISDRIEAMKVLAQDSGQMHDLMERFVREIKVVAGLEHPNIAQLRTALRYQNQLVMVMEYVDGAPLDGMLSERRVGLWQGVDYICQVLGALGYAHSQGVVHRDIKPPNILVTGKNVVKLTDFGIASKLGDPRLTVAGTALGSVFYMSPEQVRAEPPDGRSDIYSVGVTLYEVVTGQRPIQGDSHFSIMRAHLEQIPQPPRELSPSVPAELSAVILMALEKDPAARFQTADDFLSALLAVGRGTLPAVGLRPVPSHDARTATMASQQRFPSSPVGVATPPGLPSVPPSGSQGSSAAAGAASQSKSISAKSWTPAVIEKLRTELADYIGPLANLIVNRAAKKAQSLDELYDILAAEIPSDDDRKKFRASRRI